MEINDITRCAFMAPDPKIMTVDLDRVNDVAKKMREARDKDNPAFAGVHPDKTPQAELQRLRRELFNLTERAKSTETYCNNKAGEVKLLEQQITDALGHKKEAVSSGNALAERNWERTIQRLEGERDEAAKEFQRARKVSAEAANALKHWPHRERVAEVEKSLGA